MVSDHQPSVATSPLHRGVYGNGAARLPQLPATFSAYSSYPENRTALGRIVGYQQAPGLALQNSGARGLIASGH